MKFKQIAQRFLMPSFLVSLYYFLKYKAKVSPKAEVEFTPNLKLGRGVTISSFCKVKATESKLTIGDNTGFAIGCFLATGKKGITIGDYCAFGSSVSVVSVNYGYDKRDVPFKKQEQISKGIEIGNNVLIGSNVTITDGAKIGDNCVVVANSLINRKYPANCILQGAPAKIILKRES